MPNSIIVREKPKVKIPKTGEQTKITSKVKEVASGINGDGVVAAINIAKHIKSMGEADGPQPDFTRTADEVLEDGKFNGCNEAGVVYASLLRAKGIPTTFIYALNKKAVANYTKERPSLKTHVFLRVDFGDGGENKQIINSTTGEIAEAIPENMMIGREGLDTWDVGLRVGFDDLQEVFEEKHGQPSTQDENK